MKLQLKRISMKRMTLRHSILGFVVFVTLVLVVISLSAEPMPKTSVPPSQPPDTNDVKPPHEGVVVTSDGVHLFYEVIGNGPETVVIPGRLFLIHTLRQLAEGRRLIFYDTRARGKSDAIHDAKRETIQDDDLLLSASGRFGQKNFERIWNGLSSSRETVNLLKEWWNCLESFLLAV
jgi:hypothetical protein